MILHDIEDNNENENEYSYISSSSDVGKLGPKFDCRYFKEGSIEGLFKPNEGKTKESELDGKTSIFKVIKKPFYEKDINNLIKKMNFDEEIEK